jgi:hypothetical protein
MTRGTKPTSLLSRILTVPKKKKIRGARIVKISAPLIEVDGLKNRAVFLRGC